MLSKEDDSQSEFNVSFDDEDYESSARTDSPKKITNILLRSNSKFLLDEENEEEIDSYSENPRIMTKEPQEILI